MSEFKADSISIVYSKDGWYESVNVETLSKEAKRAILEAVKNKLDSRRPAKLSIQPSPASTGTSQARGGSLETLLRGPQGS